MCSYQISRISACCHFDKASCSCGTSRGYQQWLPLCWKVLSSDVSGHRESREGNVLPSHYRVIRPWTKVSKEIDGGDWRAWSWVRFQISLRRRSACNSEPQVRMSNRRTKKIIGLFFSPWFLFGNHQGLVNVPFWVFVSHHLQISVELLYPQ